ncbi:MAG: diaminopimelate decarboxylase, partial [Saprospiraceae bacterium]
MYLNNNRYLLTGGVDPLVLCEKYGCPLYVYDSAIIERQYQRILDAFNVPKLKINYACKASSNL